MASLENGERTGTRSQSNLIEAHQGVPEAKNRIIRRHTRKDKCLKPFSITSLNQGRFGGRVTQIRNILLLEMESSADASRSLRHRFEQERQKIDNSQC